MRIAIRGSGPAGGTRRWLAWTITAISVALIGAAPGTAAPSSAPDTPDYADPAAWLCRPDQPADVCGRSDQDAVVLQADGSTSVERFRADPRAPVDCFYVYPTVSRDPGGNAAMKVAAEYVAVVNQQFARFGAVCRRFAPMYAAGDARGAPRQYKGRADPD